MNWICKLAGHRWTKWSWQWSAGNRMSNRLGSVGPVHGESRDCKRCKEHQKREFAWHATEEQKRMMREDGHPIVDSLEDK